MKLLLSAIASAFLLWKASDLVPQTDTDCDIYELYADCSFRGFNDIPNNLPENTTCLNMAGNNLSKINGDRWENYKSLQKLSLAQNNIESIDDESFKFLEELAMLDLSLNKIRYNNISESVFKPLKKLTYLDLKQNLTNIQPTERYPASLEHLGNLTTLMIDGLGQQPLPTLPKLTQLYFSGQYGRCNITFLERNIFLFTRNIKNLFMSNCSIEIVEHGVLSSLPNIASLDISRNTKLGFVSLTNISVGVVNNTEFKRLNINHVYEYGIGCTTITVDELMFFNNTQLELMTLEGNSMVGLEQDAIFYIPKSLKYMSVRDNIMMRGKYAYEVIKSGILQNLVYYDSSEQFRSHIPNVIDAFESESVIVKRRERPATEIRRVSNCDNMFTRSMFRDYFEIIDERIKQFNITPVNAEKEENRLHESNIEYLDLSDNIPGTDKLAQIIFRNAPRIKYLNLSNNHAGYPNLSRNEIFLNFTNLRHLDLSLNGIHFIQRQAFEKQIYLENLYLSKNKLRHISFNMSGMPQLQYLDLGYNYFETLSDDEITVFDRLKNLKINLAHNRLQCTCPNTKTAVWILENRHRFKHFKKTNCTFENLSTVAFDDLNLKQLLLECSPPTYLALILGLSLGILTFIIIVSCGIVYRFKWNLRYLYYMAKFRLIGQYQPLEDREYEKDVFVSYANEDREFVCEFVVTELETKGNMSLLVHERDFKPGEFVADNIVRAITSSRKTLVILTHAYVQSKWCMYELNMARMEAADTGRNVLCVILKEDVPTKYLPIEVIDIIKKKTYLEFPEENIHMDKFWERLRATLICRAK